MLWKSDVKRDPYISHIFHHRTSFIKSPGAIHQSWQNTPQTLQRLFLAAGMLILLFAKLSLISPRFLFCDIQVASLQQQWQIKPKRASISPADDTERTSLCIRATLVAGTWFAKLLALKRCNLAGKKKQRYTGKKTTWQMVALRSRARVLWDYIPSVRISSSAYRLSDPGWVNWLLCASVSPWWWFSH